MGREHRYRAIKVAAFAMSCLLISSMAWMVQALESRTRLTQYAHKAWQIGDAGLLGTPQSIAQTKDGYIWVSTSDGLFRFDGVHFVRVSALLAGSAGPLWIGTTDMGLSRHLRGRLHHIDADNGLTG